MQIEARRVEAIETTDDVDWGALITAAATFAVAVIEAC